MSIGIGLTVLGVCILLAAVALAKGYVEAARITFYKDNPDRGSPWGA